jgi:hypothetical protein
MAFPGDSLQRHAAPKVTKVRLGKMAAGQGRPADEVR